MTLPRLSVYVLNAQKRFLDALDISSQLVKFLNYVHTISCQKIS